MNPYEVENLEPHEPRRKATVGPSRLFWLLMVIVGGLTIGLIVLLVFGALIIRSAITG